MTYQVDSVVADGLSLPALKSHLDIGSGDVELVAIGALGVADSPRLAGESLGHIRALAESEAQMPPIVVHRRTMRVIDGMHRIRAAVVRGDEEIAVRFFDGDEPTAFVLGVELNVAHGLPLSRADRRAAAERIVRSHSHWSDRMIASSTGLSPKTVGVIRAKVDVGSLASAARLGRDGRLRRVRTLAVPRLSTTTVDGVTGSTQVLAQEHGGACSDDSDEHRQPPCTSIDRIALPEQRRAPSDSIVRPGTLRHESVSADHGGGLASLQRDPSLRHNDAGRHLLRILSLHSLPAADWEQLAGAIPEHCASRVADLARACAASWEEFAQRVHATVSDE